MRINHNIASLNTYRQLTSNNAAGSKSLEKLSSGLRINRAGDDAAGLAISEKMRSQIRGLDQASRNAQDGISLIQTAEGALSETHSMLQRMRELVVQANNGTNTDADKTKIQDEIKELQTEISKLADRTEFNSQKLLDGTFGGSTANVGTGFANKLDISVSGAQVATGYKITTGAGGGNATAEVNGTALVAGNVTFSTAAKTDVRVNLEVDGYKLGDVDLNTVEAKDYVDDAAGVALNYDELATDLATDINAAITAYNTANGTSISAVTVENNEGALRIKSGTNGNDERSQIEIGTAGGTDAATLLGINGQSSDIDNSITIENESLGIKEKIYGIDTTKTTEGQTISFNKTGITLKVSDDGDATPNEIVNISSITANNKFDVAEGSVDLQIGANKSQQMSLSLGDMDATALAVDTINVAAPTWDSNQFNADLDSIDAAITKVSAERSKLGAWQNRLDHTINNLGTSSENLTAAESRVRDVDMAKEMMEFTKNNILTQAAQAMLAQANQQPQGILQLLR